MVNEQEPESTEDESPDAEDGSLLPVDLDAPLMFGLPVVAADGEVLGTVDEDVAGRFKVAAPLAADYWLPKNLIAGMAPGGDLIVSVDKHSLDAAKVAEPDNP